MAAQDDVGGADCLFCASSRRCPRCSDLGRGKYHQFPPANPDPGGHRRDPHVPARPAGDENVSRDAQSHQSRSSSFRDWLLRFGRIGRVACPHHFDPEREFCQASSCLHRPSAGLHGRSYLSIRPHIRVARRSAREVCINKLYELAHRPRGISFSPSTTDSDSVRVTRSHCACDRNNCPTPTKTHHC